MSFMPHTVLGSWDVRVRKTAAWPQGVDHIALLDDPTLLCFAPA